MLIHIEIPNPLKPKLFGGHEIIAHLYYKIYPGDVTGEVDQYQIYDEHLDDWVCVDLAKLGKHGHERLQKTIDKHVLENPEIFEKEGA